MLGIQSGAYAQLPVAPNQYQPQGNYAMGVAENLVPKYVPSWIGATTVSTPTKTMNETSDTLQVIDATANAVNITLPAATGGPTQALGHPFAFKAINVSNTITLTAKAGDTIDGAATLVLNTLNQAVILESDGSHTWRVLSNSTGGGGGGGNVSSFSAGNLSPLFTTNVATPTTTPALSFALNNAGAHTWFGNNTASSTAPAFLTSTQLTADLDVFTSGLKGLAPPSGGGTVNYLRADGTWATPPGTSIGTVTSVSTTSAPAWLSSSWATATTTPAQTIGTPTGLTANQFLATPNGATGAVGLRSIVAADLPAPTIGYSSTARTSNFNAVAGNAYDIDLSSGNVTATLPDATLCAGQTITFTIVAQYAGNNLILNTTSSQLINMYNSGDIQVYLTYSVYNLTSNGANWRIVSTST